MALPLKRLNTKHSRVFGRRSEQSAELQQVAALSRTVPVHAPRSEGAQILNLPSVAGAANGGREPIVTDAAWRSNVGLIPIKAPLC